MTCLLVLIGATFPRVALALMWFFAYTQTAFETRLWPLVGFFFMPYTTCAYAIGMNERGEFKGWTLALLIVGVIFDQMNVHGGVWKARKRSVKRERQRH